MPEPDDKFRSRFEIKRELGRGGMGEVYLAYDQFQQRDVAVKLALSSMLQDSEDGHRIRRMWLNETRLAGKLHHPYIVETYESGVTDEFSYLVMEYVPCGTLKEYTTPDKLLAVEAVIELTYKVCNALDYASKQGLLHRDIKPSNILLADPSTPKVTDFGTCYFTDAEVTQVFDVGTLPFMPPEHFTRAPPTIQSDIYAVGVMTYQLLTGTYPFQAGSYESMIYEKLNEDFTPLEKRRHDIPGELRFAVHRAIQKPRELRYTAWSDFCDDLALALPRANRSREVEFDSARFGMLRDMPFFAEFSDTELWETIRLSIWTDKSFSDVIVSEGSADRNIYVIASGDVVVTRAGVALGVLGAGECFGEIAYVDEQSQIRTATVTAATGLVLIEIDADALRAASAALQTAFGRAFMRLMVSRLKHADKRFLQTLGAHA